MNGTPRDTAFAAPVAQPRVDYDLLTVDIWDTLLRRRCHPDAVKLHLCRVLLMWHGHDLPSSSRAQWKLLDLRRQAEKEIGTRSKEEGLDDEYRHDEVYRVWLKLAGLPHTDDTGDLISRLEAAELAQERYVSYADPTIAETLQGHSAARRMFLSDFYFPAAAMRKLLRHHGLDNCVSDGMVSCDVGVNKRSGRLFSHLHALFDVSPQRHLHVGDNPHADVAAARALGINSVHYLPPEEHARRQSIEAGFHARTDFLRESAHKLRLPSDTASRSAADIHAFGVRCAPLFVGFVLDVMERATAAGASQIYFFTREGEFFAELYRRLAAADMLGVSTPQARLLEVSRIATFAGSLRALTTDELMRIWNQYSVQSIGALLVSLGMDTPDFAADAARLGVDLDLQVRYPWQDARVTAFLDDSSVRSRIESHLDARRHALHAYLAFAGVDNRGTLHIVDIGWRGTIQDNLAHALPDTQIVGHYLGLNRYLNPQPGNVEKSAFGPDVNRSGDFATLLDFVAPIEMLSNSASGSVTAYLVGVGGIEVERKVDPDENAVFESCSRHFQAGVLDAAPLWADFIRTHAYSAAEIRPYAMQIWSEIINSPPPFLASAYFRLKHNESFGVGGFADKREQLPATSVLRALVSRPRRLELEQWLAACGWLPGLLANPETDKKLRRALRLYLGLRAAKIRLASRFRSHA